MITLKMTALLAYVSFAALMAFYMRLNLPFWRRTANAALIVGFVAHTLLLCSIELTRAYPIPETLFETGVMFSWIGMAVALGIRLIRRSGIAVAVMTTTFASVFLISCPLDAVRIDLAPEDQTLFIGLHVALMIIGLCLLLTGTGISALYLVQQRALKQKRSFDLLSRLPPLETLEWFNTRLAVWGFIGLTLGLILGLLGAFHHWEGRLFLDPKVLVSFGGWAFYGLFLVAVRQWTLSGRRVALISIVGFIALMVLFVGTQFFFVTHHTY